MIWALVIADVLVTTYLIWLVVTAYGRIRKLSESEADLIFKLSREKALRSGYERAYNEEVARLSGVMMRLEYAESRMRPVGDEGA